MLETERYQRESEKSDKVDRELNWVRQRKWVQRKSGLEREREMSLEINGRDETQVRESGFERIQREKVGRRRNRLERESGQREIRQRQAREKWVQGESW